jgi:predicted ATPase
MSSELEYIQVNGFKSIQNQKLDLRNLNVLIGANGSGKSNFISIFRLLNEVYEERLQAYTGSIGADSLLYYGRKTTSRIEINLSFKGREKGLANGYKISLIPSDKDTLIFEREAVWFHDRNKNYPNPKSDIIGSGNKETGLFEASKQNPYQVVADYVIGALRSWKLYHFHDTSSSSNMKKQQNINDNERLQPDASNIAAFLYLLQERFPQNYKRIIGNIRRVTPFFDDFVLSPLRLNPDNILLQWRDVNSDNLFNAHSLSDGTLRFICLATLLLQPELPSVILIDEPELGLHPFAINVLAGLVRSAATKTQIIISTQSVPLVNQFQPSDILVVDREGGQSVFRHVDDEELKDWMTQYSGYGLGDLWEKNILGGRPQPEPQ